MHIYLISLNANDLPLNVWPPECVFHDTDPFQLLRSNFHLPMDSVVGNGIGEVIIYTSHEPGTSFTINYSLIFSGKTLNNLWYLRPHQTYIHTCSQALSDNLKQFSIYLLANELYIYVYSHAIYFVPMNYGIFICTSIYEWNARRKWTQWTTEETNDQWKAIIFDIVWYLQHMSDCINAKRLLSS